MQENNNKPKALKEFLEEEIEELLSESPETSAIQKDKDNIISNDKDPNNKNFIQIIRENINSMRSNLEGCYNKLIIFDNDMITIEKDSKKKNSFIIKCDKINEKLLQKLTQEENNEYFIEENKYKNINIDITKLIYPEANIVKQEQEKKEKEEEKFSIRFKSDIKIHKANNKVNINSFMKGPSGGFSNTKFNKGMFILKNKSTLPQIEEQKMRQTVSLNNQYLKVKYDRSNDQSQYAYIIRKDGENKSAIVMPNFGKTLSSYIKLLSNIEEKLNLIKDEGKKNKIKNFISFFEEKIIKHLIEALADLEEAEIVHKDIKPDNITLKSENLDNLIEIFQFQKIEAMNFKQLNLIDDVKLTIVDFGLACTSKNTEGKCGTQYYMAPEYENINKKYDIYSLGVTIINILSRNQVITDAKKNEKRIKIIISEIAKDKAHIEKMNLNDKGYKLYANTELRKKIGSKLSQIYNNDTDYLNNKQIQNAIINCIGNFDSEKLLFLCQTQLQNVIFNVEAQKFIKEYSSNTQKKHNSTLLEIANLLMLDFNPEKRKGAKDIYNYLENTLSAKLINKYQKTQGKNVKFHIMKNIYNSKETSEKKIQEIFIAAAMHCENELYEIRKPTMFSRVTGMKIFLDELYQMEEEDRKVIIDNINASFKMSLDYNTKPAVNTVINHLYNEVQNQHDKTSVLKETIKKIENNLNKLAVKVIANAKPLGSHNIKLLRM